MWIVGGQVKGKVKCDKEGQRIKLNGLFFFGNKKTKWAPAKPQTYKKGYEGSGQPKYNILMLNSLRPETVSRCSRCSKASGRFI